MPEQTDTDTDDAAAPASTRYADRKSAGRRPASMEFPDDLYDRLRARSQVEERSMAAINRQAVREYLDKVGG